MKKRILVFATFLLAALPSVFADIGEDFAKGGIGLSGSISIYNDFYYFMDPVEQRKYWSFDFSPGFAYFVADRVALQLSPWYYHRESTLDPDNIDRSTSYGLRFGVSYAFAMDPSAQQGPVFTIGAFIGFAVYPTVDDRVGGVESPNNNDMAELQLTAAPRVYYFLNDRLAPYVGISPRLSYIIGYEDVSGATIDLTNSQRYHADITLTVGIAYFIPSQKASVF